MNKFLGYLGIGTFVCSCIAILCGLGYVIVGEIKRNPNVIIKQNSEYLWVKTYSIYNEDSCVYKYHQPIVYEGEVVNRRTIFVGMAGKGGHWVYKTNIKYNGDKEYVKSGIHYYNNHKEGDIVKVKVSFYPWQEIEVLN